MTSKRRNSILILSTMVAVFIIVGVIYKQTKPTDQAQRHTSKRDNLSTIKIF